MNDKHYSWSDYLTLSLMPILESHNMTSATASNNSLNVSHLITIELLIYLIPCLLLAAWVSWSSRGSSLKYRLITQSGDCRSQARPLELSIIREIALFRWTISSFLQLFIQLFHRVRNIITKGSSIILPSFENVCCLPPCLIRQIENKVNELGWILPW